MPAEMPTSELLILFITDVMLSPSNTLISTDLSPNDSMKLPSEKVMSVFTYALPVNVEYLSYVPVEVIELLAEEYSISPAKPAKLEVPPNSRFSVPASFDTIVNLPSESKEAVYFPVALILSIIF